MTAVTVEKKRKVAATEFRSQSTGTVLAQSLKRPNPPRQVFTINSTQTSTHENYTLLDAIKIKNLINSKKNRINYKTKVRRAKIYKHFTIPNEVILQ